MPYLGSWKVDDLLTFPANTHAAATGAATDADAVPAYRVYEDETGTAILTGNMAKLDDANTVGFYSEQITLSAANGFEKGKCYTLYISAAVSSVTGTMSHTFQMEAEVDANAVSGAVPSVTGAVGSVTGNVGGNVVGSVASVTAGVTLAASAIQAIWDALTSALTTVGSIGKLLVDNINATISSRASQTSVDDLPTNAELATSQASADDATLAAIAALNNLSAAQVNAEADTALVDVGLTTTITGRIDAAISSRLATAGYTAPPSVADILAGVVEGTITVKGALRLALSALSGKASGGGTTTVIFRDTGDTKARITATVDSSGNRTAITRDITD